MSMFVLPFAMAKKERDILYLTKIVILSSVAPVLYGLFQLGTGIDWYQGSRVESSFTHPNIFEAYLPCAVTLPSHLYLRPGLNNDAMWSNELGPAVIENAIDMPAGRR